MEKIIISVESTINAPLTTVWDCWTNPEHIKGWTFASDDWHSPIATNDLQTGRKFLTRMEAKDGSFGFDFEGTYTLVEPLKKIEYVLADEREVKIAFIDEGNSIKVIESFNPENENPIELQQGGWQAILNNFKKYVESK
ncbi:MAG: SRPBCC family protein [Bacteroidota bacterium]